MGGIRLSTTYFRVTADTSADVLLAANTSRSRAVIVNIGSVTSYVGFDAGVDAEGGTTPGVPLYPGEAMTVEHVLAVYGVTLSGTATFDGWEEE